MTMRVDVQVTIDHPLEEVFAYITNFENNPKWQSGIQSCKFITEPPLRIGSRYEQVASFMGRRIVSVFEVVEYEPNRMVRFHSISGTFPIRILRSVESTYSGSVVSATIEGEPTGLLKLMTPLARPMMRRSIESDYQRLKMILETEDNIST